MNEEYNPTNRVLDIIHNMYIQIYEQYDDINDIIDTTFFITKYIVCFFVNIVIRISNISFFYMVEVH